jgi:hypothetical protein
VVGDPEAIYNMFYFKNCYKNHVVSISVIQLIETTFMYIQI